MHIRYFKKGCLASQPAAYQHSLQSVISLILLVSFPANMSDQRGPICGGISGELQGEKLQEALELLDKSLAQLATGNGPSFK